MTTQVYFVTSSARNVLTVPLGAVTFADAAGGPKAARPGDARNSAAVPGEGGGRRPQGVSVSGPNIATAPDERAREGSGSLPGGFPQADARRRGGAGAAAARATVPREGKVRVVAADGSISERDVVIGVTSRVTAEVLSGLTEGEQVVAGIAQAAAQGANNNANQFNNNNFNNNNFNRGFQGGNNFGGGGFPGGFPGGR
jgi:macrolide-specific efflux system membrane fusion protein